MGEEQLTSGGPEPNLFKLEGKGVWITYGILRLRREFLDYRDEQRELTFSGEKGEIDSLERKIGKLITVTLAAVSDSHTHTLTLLLPKINFDQEIDFAPLPGKPYFNIEREWREEFIYFLMVDRFHDDTPRRPVKQAGRSLGNQVPDNAFYGGKIKGITQNLDYIAGLGCTAIWLSPVLVNNPGAYHGYNINNYLDIDPHFGTKQDLIDLVDSGHNFKKDGKPFPIRIILDVVINHSGDNWEYKGGPKNFNDIKFDFGAFRADPPAPFRSNCVMPSFITGVAIYPTSTRFRKTSMGIFPALRIMKTVTMSRARNSSIS